MITLLAPRVGQISTPRPPASYLPLHQNVESRKDAEDVMTEASSYEEKMSFLFGASITTQHSAS